MIVLGIDCSSSTVGWGIIEINNNVPSLVAHGHIKPLKEKKTSIIDSLDDLNIKLTEICNQFKPQYIFVEELIKFMKGKSTADTIIKLAVYNRSASYFIYKASLIKPHFYYPITIRSQISKYLKVSKPSKEDLPNLLLNKFPNLSIKTIKKGKFKGTPVKETFDECDAIATALGGSLKLKLIK